MLLFVYSKLREEKRRKKKMAMRNRDSQHSRFSSGPLRRAHKRIGQINAILKMCFVLENIFSISLSRYSGVVPKQESFRRHRRRRHHHLHRRSCNILQLPSALGLCIIFFWFEFSMAKSWSTLFVQTNAHSLSPATTEKSVSRFLVAACACVRHP